MNAVVAPGQRLPAQAEEKTKVPGAFDHVASTYDLLTGASPGYHRHLRESAAQLGLTGSGSVLDLCCGTGASTAAIQAVWPDAEITALDASDGMLDIAKSKTDIRARWLLGDAMDPAAHGASGPYDAVLMAYGLRNVPDPDRCLRRVRDLMKPGATIVFHEYSLDGTTTRAILWTLICWLIIIPGGLLTSGNPSLYHYLWRSVRSFDGVDALKARLRAHGFVDVRAVPMDGIQRGITWSFVARRP